MFFKPWGLAVACILLLLAAIPIAYASIQPLIAEPCGNDYNGEGGCGGGGGGNYPSPTPTITPTPIPTPVPLNDSIYYDANGNRVLAGGLSYEYDGFNQLARVRNVTAGGIAIEEYVYDQDGNRLMKYEPQINQTTYYVNENYVEVVNSSGTFPTIYFYENDVLVGRKDSDGSKYYYHPDHLGSTTLVTNDMGSAVENTAYEPFGSQLEGGTTASGKYTYTGKEKDSGTGLYYYGARYYDARIGQFAQADTFLANPFDPQQLNRYSYTINNPFKYTDPTGHWLDSFIDMVSLSNDIEDLRKEQNLVNILAVAADLGTLALPGFVAGGTILKKGINGADMITRSEDVLKVSNKVDTVADAANGAKMGDKVADVSKQSSEVSDYAKYTEESAAHAKPRHLDQGQFEGKSKWFPGTDISKMSTEIQTKGDSFIAKNGYIVTNANLGRPVGYVTKAGGTVTTILTGGRVVSSKITNTVITAYPIAGNICRR